MAVLLAVSISTLAGAQDREPEPIKPPRPDAGESDADTPRVRIKPITQLGVSIDPPQGSLPKDLAHEAMAEDPTPAGMVLVRGWPVMQYNWAAPGSRHNPLYFEEVNLERYGYACSTCLQPAVSGAHFFCTIPALPYLMAVDCPCECEYALGHWRPGNCNPWRDHCPPCRLDAAAAEAGVATGLIFLIP
ncbi:MAG: hypothetical protein KDA37_06545 [Planctomycetales bacterium]|nr:hypothetical protein [Planctomycetales bacterium]